MATSAAFQASSTRETPKIISQGAALKVAVAAWAPKINAAARKSCWGWVSAAQSGVHHLEEEKPVP